MTDVINFIYTIMNKCVTFLKGCTFQLFGYPVDLWGIFFFFIVLAVILSVFWKSGKY